MSEVVTQKSRSDPFARPHDLIGYIRIHAETPRALISVKHLVLAYYLAGWALDGITKKYYLETKEFQSLHNYDWRSLCQDADERMLQGLVPHDWKQVLEASLP